MGERAPIRSDSLWLCAQQCARMRAFKKCRRRRFDAVECSHCKWDVANYIDTDPASLRLFMLQAEQDAVDEQYERGTSKIGWAVLILVFAACVGASVFECVSNNLYWKTHGPEQQVVSNAHAVRVSDALNFAANSLRARKDINKDGKINCIDAAIFFYHAYTAPGEIQITSNKHPDGRMNHLFISIRINGKWYGIEPQAQWKGYPSYWMTDVWGSKYDPQYNRDATAYYKRYADY